MPRPKNTPNAAQMLRVARMFYEDDKSKQDIAEKEKIDSRKVKWLLEQAKELDLVRITFRGTTESDLEHRIIRKYPHMLRVLILPLHGPVETTNQYGELLQRFALAAADHFDDLLKSHTSDMPLHVGISGGETLLEFVNAVPEQTRKNLHLHATTVVPHGQLAMSASHVDPSTNATILWAKSGRLPGHCHYTTVTPYDTKKRGMEARVFIRERLEELDRNSKIRAVIQGMQNLDVVYAGIGTLTPPAKADPIMKNRLTIMSLLEPLVTMKDLIKEKAVGDVSYCLIDADGNTSDDWRFFPRVGDYSEFKGEEFYRKMVEKKKAVIAMAGPYKLQPIKAALRGKLINTLITDEETARQLAEGD